MVRVSLLKLCKTCINQFLTIVYLVALVETSYILHSSALIEDQTTGKYVRLEYVVRYVPRIASVLHVSLPKARTQVLRSASNRSHCADTAVISFPEMVLGFTKIDNLHLMGRQEEEQIGWLQITMAYADRLQVAERGDNTDNHFLQFVLLPVGACTFPLTEHVFQVGATVHVLTDHGDAVRVVHRLVEVVPEKLEHVRVALHLK